MTTTEVPPLPEPISTSLTFSLAGIACSAQHKHTLHDALQILLPSTVGYMQS